MDLPPAHRIVFDQALCHASLLIERLLFYTRNLGLLPRTSTASDPLGPIVVSDEDVATIFSGFRKISKTDAQRRPTLVADPLGTEIAESRKAFLAVLAEETAKNIGFVEIVRAFGLTEAALDPFLLAIVPEWDARFGRLFGFLNNDVSRQRPTFGHLQLALQQGLPTVSIEALDVIQRHLLRTGLIEIDKVGDAPQANQVVRVPGHIVEFSRTVLSSVEAVTERRGWKRLFWEPEEKRRFSRALRREIMERPAASRLVILEGTPGSGRCAAAHATAESAGLGSIECTLFPDPETEVERRLAEKLFHAKIARALLIVRSDGVLGAKPDLWRKLGQLAVTLEVRCFVLVRPDESLPEDNSTRFIRLTPPLMMPSYRRMLWSEAFGKAHLTVDPDVLHHIAMHFSITPGRIHELVAETQIRMKASSTSRIEVAEISAALRDITVQKLKGQASLYVADSTLDDLILEASTRERLDELVHRMQLRYEVLDGWRFGGRSMRGYGVTALFAGPPGTGKTAAAGAVAHALGLDLYIVDLSRIMSKWVGETEQNLSRVFDEAEASSVALLFDEADSLFGKRSADVKSASDRFANVTVNYLLQRMERYSGLAILTTNLESAIDSAFSRRISSRIYFADPDEEHRRKLWSQLLPPGVEFDSDVQLGSIVRILEMPGARIRSALMRAAFRAASSGRKKQVLTQDDIYWSAMMEYEDMGRLPPMPEQGRSGEGRPVSRNPARFDDTDPEDDPDGGSEGGDQDEDDGDDDER